MKSYIKSVTEKTLTKANKVFGREFKSIEIRFDIRGRCAGMYCVDRNGSKYFRYNMDIAEKNGKDVFNTTIIHEICHYIANSIYKTYIRPHGKEWQTIMRSMGIVDPKTCHKMKCAPARKVARVPFKCNCTTHMITLNMRTKMRNGQRRICNKCKTRLVEV